MPTISDSAFGHHDKVVTVIYIARGSDTLGPYNSLEAAALVIGGYLRPDDYAACNGDPTWVSLANFLPLSAVPPVTAPASSPAASTVGVPSHRWRSWGITLAILLAASLLVAGGMYWFRHRQADARANVLTAPQDERASGVASLPPAQVLPGIREPEPPPAASGPLTGSISFAPPGGERMPLAGVRVAAYPLAALEPVLAQETIEAQAARARLDPQIEAAARDQVTRAAETQAALKALREADPAAPLTASLRFANQGAKAAAKTAEGDYRYLVDERAAAAGGEFYFHGLPASAVTTDTDVQGNFTLAIPPGDEPYAVAVAARAMTEDGSARSCYWLLKLSPSQRAGREGLRLDSSNVSSSSAAESLIHTAD